MPARSQTRLSSLATSESNGTNSSQYSIPYKMGFENLKVFYINLLFNMNLIYTVNDANILWIWLD